MAAVAAAVVTAVTASQALVQALVQAPVLVLVPVLAPGQAMLMLVLVLTVARVPGTEPMQGQVSEEAAVGAVGAMEVTGVVVQEVQGADKPTGAQMQALAPAAQAAQTQGLVTHSCTQ